MKKKAERLLKRVPLWSGLEQETLWQNCIHINIMNKCLWWCFYISLISWINVCGGVFTSRHRSRPAVLRKCHQLKVSFLQAYFHSVVTGDHRKHTHYTSATRAVTAEQWVDVTYHLLHVLSRKTSLKLITLWSL